MRLRRERNALVELRREDARAEVGGVAGRDAVEAREVSEQLMLL